MNTGELLELLGTNFKDICSATFPVFGALRVLGSWVEDPIPAFVCLTIESSIWNMYIVIIATAVLTLLHVDKDSIIMAIKSIL